MQAQFSAKSGTAAQPAKAAKAERVPVVTLVVDEKVFLPNGKVTTAGAPRTITMKAARYDEYMIKGKDDRNMFDSLPDKIISVEDPREKKAKTK